MANQRFSRSTGGAPAERIEARREDRGQRWRLFRLTAQAVASDLTLVQRVLWQEIAAPYRTTYRLH
jgi:hypothetical protein